MNRSDIRLLAGRASALQERPTERLAEVHGRIADARRQRRTSLVTGIAVVAVLVAVGAVALTTGRDDEAPEPAPVPGSVSAPERGTCWAVPTDVVPEDYWYDDSPQVPCTEEHTSETVLSYPLDEATPEAAEEYVDRCGEAVRNYLGVDQASWIGWGWINVLPSEEQIDDGAAWLRCDAVFPTRWDFSPLRVLTSPVLAAADQRAADFWTCLDQPPAVDDQPLVPCNRPHLYEQTGTLAVISGPQDYPSKAERDREEAQCRRAVPARLAGVSVLTVWQPRESFDPYTGLVGICLMFNADGRPLPGR